MIFILPANTVIKVEGIPVTLLRETKIQTTEVNWLAIQESHRKKELEDGSKSLPVHEFS